MKLWFVDYDGYVEPVEDDHQVAALESGDCYRDFEPLKPNEDGSFYCPCCFNQYVKSDEWTLIQQVISKTDNGRLIGLRFKLW